MNIFFSGIGGVGIGPLAEIALDAGYRIQGSDLSAGLLTEELQKRGVSIHFDQDGSFLRECHEITPLDWFVHTAALPENHPELLLAHELGIKTAKRDELLAHIIADKQLKLIAIAGTHGKTTTTGMAVWTLKQLGIPVSYSVGTTLSWGPSGHFDSASEYFVYECDEFDRNFLHFSPHLSIITTIDYDHPDTYPTEQSYVEAFNDFIRQSRTAVMYQQDLDDTSVVKGSDVLLHIIDKKAIVSDGRVDQIKLAGQHNRENAYLVRTALREHLGCPDEELVPALASFPGTQRRFEKLADNLYSDYGHHPVEIAATLQMARELSDEVILVYQPHQNVRQHEIKDDYIDQFELAKKVYWLPTYLSREDPSLLILSPEELIKNITNKEHIEVAELNDELWHAIESARTNNKLVLAMGAGSIDSWLRKQL